MTEARHNTSGDEATALGDLQPRIVKVAGGVAVLGLLLALGGVAVGDHGGERFFYAYLINYAFILTLALGAMFFVLLQHVCAAGWSVTVRRLAEIYAGVMPMLAILFIPVLVGLLQFDLYPWVHPDPHDAILQGKLVYLNVPFFIGRWLLYFALWIWIGRWMLSRSRQQDDGGEPGLSLKLRALSAPMMIIYALTTSFASFDLLMSLDPHFFSTIYPVYFFSGAAVGSLALLVLTSVLLQGRGILSQSITTEHYHDLGKLLFAFVFFWGYIAFSQYMLIWYGAIPEETGWFVRRGATTVPAHQNTYSAVILILLFGHFFIPFAGLLSRHVKRRKMVLACWSVWLLAMHWLDLMWLVRPDLADHATHESILISVGDVLCWAGTFAALTGIYILSAARLAGDRSLLAKGDPRLDESLAFHQTV